MLQNANKSDASQTDDIESCFTLSIELRPLDCWNELVYAGSTESLHLYHSTQWANRLQRLLGDTPWYVTVRRNGVAVLMVLAFEEARRRTRGVGIRRLVSFIRNQLNRRQGCRWYGQPVAVGVAGAEAFDFLAVSLGEHLRMRGWRLAGGEWPLEFETAIPPGWQSRKWATLRVDLTPDLPTILDRFKPAARKEIRKAETKSIEVRQIATIPELIAYAKEAVICAARYGRTDVSIEDFISMWDNLRTENTFFETFAAWHEGHFVAGLSIWGTRHCVGELGSFQSAYAFDRKLSGPDLIKWHVIRWAKSQGIGALDLAGINPAPATSKEENIRRFKEKWGGRFYEYVVLEARRP